jgi:hypothetical protein
MWTFRCCWAFLLGLALASPAFAGEAPGPIESYELIPSIPVEGEPFVLSMIYGDGMLLGEDLSTVTVTNNVVSVALDFEHAICPPLLVCPPSLVGAISIPPLPAGEYSLHLSDTDDTPHVDLISSFVVSGAAQPTALPALSKFGVLWLVVCLAALAFIAAHKRESRTLA